MKYKFKVSVSKRMYATGGVTVDAADCDQAQEIVENRISDGELQTSDVEWDEPQYEDLSFETTGDCDAL